VHVVLGILFAFAILTLWVPTEWPVSVFETGVFSILGLLVWRHRRSGIPFSFPIIPLSFAVLLGLFQIWSGRTVYGFGTKAETAQWAAFLSVFLIGLYLFQDHGVAERFRSAVIWFGLCLALLTILEIFTSGGKVFWLFQTDTDPLPGTMLSRNHYAAFMEAILPFAIYGALRGGANSLFCSWAAAIMYASVIAAASRAGVILTSAEFVMVTVLMRRQVLWSHGLRRLAILGVFLGVFVAVVGWQTVWSRFQIPNPGADRREFAAVSLRMISDRPWLGSGLGTWANVYPGYARVDDGTYINRAHCDWLQWSAEGGIPLGVVMAAVFFWALRYATLSVWGIGVIAVFLHALVDYPFSRPALGSVPFLILAMVAARRKRPHRLIH